MRVVYVEDNDANFTLVRKVLEATGEVEVTGATTGEEALPLIAADPPDLVLLDLDLPGISGFELAARLKADPALSHIPLVAISASVMKQERDQALAAGCVAFVEKPFDIQRLRQVVADAAAGRELPGESRD